MSGILGRIEFGPRRCPDCDAPESDLHRVDCPQRVPDPFTHLDALADHPGTGRSWPVTVPAAATVTTALTPQQIMALLKAEADALGKILRITEINQDDIVARAEVTDKLAELRRLTVLLADGPLPR
jgi:hypothetical protein